METELDTSLMDLMKKGLSPDKLSMTNYLCGTLISLVRQGVVTYMSPVEAFATAMKCFDRLKVCLIGPFWGS